MTRMPEGGLRGVNIWLRRPLRMLYRGDAQDREVGSERICTILAGRHDADKKLDHRSYSAIVPHLEKFLGDENPHVRFHMAESLGHLKADGAKPALHRRLLHHEDNPAVRMAIHFALARMGEENSAACIRNWVRHPDTRTRASAIRYSGILGMKELLHGIESQTGPDAENEAIRICSIRAIARLGKQLSGSDRFWFRNLMKGYAREKNNPEVAIAAKWAISMLR